MTFSIQTLRRILHQQTGLAPWRVRIFSDFRRDLGLTDEQIEQVLAEITELTGLSFPADTARHLTDVFDLLIHVVLRLPEIDDAGYCHRPVPDCLTEKLPPASYVSTLTTFGSIHLN